MKTLTMVEFSTPSDFEEAKRIAAANGYGDSFAYLTSSDLPGLYCLPSRPGQPEKVVCKTEQFGFVIIQVIED